MRKQHREQVKAIESNNEFRVIDVEDTKKHVKITVEIVEVKKRFIYTVAGTPKRNSINRNVALSQVKKAAKKFLEKNM